jgi:hypothetical protein
MVVTLGYYAAGDGGHSEYRWDSASVLTDEGGAVIKPTATGSGDPGRWRLLVRGAANVRQFGARGYGAYEEAAAFQNCINFCFAYTEPTATTIAVTAVNDTTYDLYVKGATNVWTKHSYTSDGSATKNEISTGLAALINAGAESANVVATVNGSDNLVITALTSARYSLCTTIAAYLVIPWQYFYATHPMYIPGGVYYISTPLIVGSSSIGSIYGCQIYGDGFNATKLLWNGKAYNAGDATDENTTVLTMYHCTHPNVHDLTMDIVTLPRMQLHFRVDINKAINYIGTRNLTTVGGGWPTVGATQRPGGGIAAGGGLNENDNLADPQPNGQYSYGTYERTDYIGAGNAYTFIGTNGENQSIRNGGSISTVAVAATYKKCVIYGYNARGISVDGFELATYYGQGQGGTSGTHNMGFLYDEGAELSGGGGFKLQHLRLEHCWQIAKFAYPFAAAADGEYRNSPWIQLIVDEVESANSSDVVAGTSPCYVVDSAQPISLKMTGVHWQCLNTKFKVADPGIDNTYQSSIVLEACNLRNTDAGTDPTALLELTAAASNTRATPSVTMQTIGCTVSSVGTGPYVNLAAWSTVRIPDAIFGRGPLTKTGAPHARPKMISDTGIILGYGGTEIKKHMSGTGTWSGNVNAAANGYLDVTVTGAAVGDTVAVGIAGTPPALIAINGYVSSTNTVRVVVQNLDGSTATIDGATVRADVWHH